jgi:hypothetical protein
MPICAVAVNGGQQFRYRYRAIAIKFGHGVAM